MDADGRLSRRPSGWGAWGGTMTEGGGSWRDMIGAAKERAKGLTEDARTQQAIARASAGAQSATQHLDATRRKVTQEESWAEVTTAIEELVAGRPGPAAAD